VNITVRSKTTTEIRFVAEGARASWRALIGGPESVSDRGVERADRAVPAPEGNRWLQGSEGGLSGSEGVRACPNGSEGGPSGCGLR
jgi:hypothetical protein